MAIHKIDGVDAVDGGSQISSFPKKFVTLHCFGAVTKGDWVAIDLNSADASKNGLGATCEKSTAALPDLVFGVATETLTASGELKVQTAGLYGDDTQGGGATVHADTEAGDFLVADPATAGQAVPVDNNVAVAGNSHAQIKTALKAARVGIALRDDATGDYDAGETTVMIIDQGYF